MHACFVDQSAAPTRPFPVGPFQVVPSPLVGTPWTRYRVTFAGIVLGEQISRPDLAQCADRALEAFNRKAIDAATYKAIRARCAEAGAALAPALRIAHATPGFNNSKRRRPAQLAERRVCLICGEEKPIEASYRTSTGKSREKECRACQDSERRAG